MIEVQYQVRKFADVMVASQEVEPMRGWPYTEILEQLNGQPTMTPAELGALIVDAYAKSYVSSTRRESDVTQSAIDLSKMGEAALLIRRFARALGREFFDDLYLKDAFRDAREYAASEGYAFEDPEYIDLVGFLQAIVKGYRGDAAQSSTLQSAQALIDWLKSAESPIISNVAIGSFKDKVYGVSIYVPSSQPSPIYADLDFKTAGWRKALDTISKPRR
jgi:hypothetical protein